MINTHIRKTVTSYDSDDLYSQCIGCGICASLFDGCMTERDGFMRPSDELLSRLVKSPSVCPVLNLPYIYDDNIWGRCEQSYLGWSSNPEIRKSSSSGGIITSILCYLISNNLVDAVLQVGPSESEPLFAEAKVSRTLEEVCACSGSRYVSCSGLSRIGKILNSDLRYALVGRPCEIRATRMLLDENSEYRASVKYLISFFCAGVPSRDAVRRLDRLMNPNNCEVTRFRFRGEGWPGFATEVYANGEEARLSYQESWGHVLGRDIGSYCRFCFDGLGEYADISAGDAWYLSDDNQPDFDEHNGRNVVFARTKTGLELIEMMKSDGALCLEPFEDWHYLELVQKTQYERKATLRAKLLAFKLMGKKFESADVRYLKKYSSKIPWYIKLRQFLGFIKRIINGRIRVP